MSRHSKSAFETVIEAHLLQDGYVSLDREGFDRERATFPETVLAFVPDRRHVKGDIRRARRCRLPDCKRMCEVELS